MKLLVLGGSGFVSRRVVTKALSQGHQVWTVTRGHREQTPGVCSLTADRNDPEALTHALEAAGVTWDGILDCICYRPEQARIDLDVLPQFTKRLVVISTDSLYSPDAAPLPLDESCCQYMTDDSYGGDKRRMELTFLASEASGSSWTIFRPPHIYGPGSELGCYPMHTRQTDLLALLRAGEPVRLVDEGQYLLQPIYVGDLARTMIAAVDNPKAQNQIFCIAGPEVISNRDYFQLLGELLGVEIHVENVTRAEFEAERDNGYQFFRHRVYDLSKLRQAGLPVPSTTLREGLAEQIRTLEARGR